MKIRYIELLSDAVDDLERGRAFYDKQQVGVGDYFWDSLISDIESLVVFSGVHCKKYGYYQMLSKRFPYTVYYDIDVDIARVVAVLPMRRNPAWIQANMTKRG